MEQEIVAEQRREQQLEQQVEAAEQRLHPGQQSRPFLLWLATTLMHSPFEEDRGFRADRRITPYKLLDEPATMLPGSDSLRERAQWGHPWGMSTKAMLVWLDDAFGQLLASLDERGLSDNTIIMFLNDHGVLAKGSLYDGGVRTPLAVWRKGGFPTNGVVSDASVSMVDVVPTLLDLANIPYDDEAFDGQSFAHVVRRDSLEEELPAQLRQEERVIYLEVGYSRGVVKGRYKYFAMRHPEWAQELTPDERQMILDKMLASRGNMPPPRMHATRESPFGNMCLVPGGCDAEYEGTQSHVQDYFAPDHLYDLSLDPDEQQNLVADPRYASVLADLKRELREVLKSLPGTFAEFTEET